MFPYLLTSNSHHFVFQPFGGKSAFCVASPKKDRIVTCVLRSIYTLRYLLCVVPHHNFTLYAEYKQPLVPSLHVPQRMTLRPTRREKWSRYFPWISKHWRYNPQISFSIWFSFVTGFCCCLCPCCMYLFNPACLI